MGNGKSREERIKDKAREWQREIRSQTRRLDRDIDKVRQEETKLKKEISTMAAKGQNTSVQTLARQVVRSRHSIARLERTKASLASVNLHLTTAVASMSTASSLKMSAAVMKDMNKLMDIPELQKTMEEMRQEMARAEITDEMMDEGFQEDDDETEIDAEVAKVYDELGLETARLIGGTTSGLPERPAAAAPAAQPTAKSKEEDELMQRLAALQK
mmetsp:Transcript_55042/g.128768  ORF Transcript_55042/g.128768 Transcript_55042/m.128768 type:complete len:215 (-) Transcript_55042:78-722(-)